MVSIRDCDKATKSKHCLIKIYFFNEKGHRRIYWTETINEITLPIYIKTNLYLLKNKHICWENHKRVVQQIYMYFN